MGGAISRTDSGFGPLLDGANDFTLLFEESIFTTAPSAIAIIVSIAQFCSVVGEPRLVRGGSLLWLKALLGFFLAGVNIATLVLWARLPTFSTEMTLPSAGLAVVGTVFIFFFLLVEHLYFYRPSTFLSLFLSITVLVDSAKTYSCFNRLGVSPVSIMYILNCVIRLLLLVTQEVSKRHLIREESVYSNLGPEATSGFWNRSLFLWLNSTLFLGFRQVLKREDLPPLSPQFHAESLFEVFKVQWNRGETLSGHALVIPY